MRLLHDNATRTLHCCFHIVVAGTGTDAQALGLLVIVQTPKFIGSLLMMRHALPHFSPGTCKLEI